MKHSNTTTRINRLMLSTAIITALTACGGSGGSGGSGGDAGDTGSTGDVDSIEAKLVALGIDTTETPRLDTDGDALPDSYSPLGSTQSINPFAEIMLFGVDAEDPDVVISGNEMTITNLSPAANNRYNWETLHDEPLGNTPWFTGTDIRTAVTGDFDNDGIDEVAIAYQLPSDDVKLVIVQDSTEGYNISMPRVVDTNAWEELFMTRGDYDGNGTHDIVIGMVSPTGDARLVMLDNDNGALTLNGQRIDIPGQTYNISHLAMASGNLDYDNAMEFAIVANEGNLLGGGNNPGTRADHRYYIYDDAISNFALTGSGSVSADNGGGTSRAAIANISIGDVDGDSIDEVVLAGLDRFGGDSQGNNIDYNYVIQVLDDARRGHALLGEAFMPSTVTGIRQGSGDYHAMNFAHTVTADLDNDGADEFVVNQFVFNSFRTSPMGISRFDDDGDPGNGYVEIPRDMLMKEDGTSGSFNYNWQTSAFAAGDVTVDGRDNILVYSQRAGTTTSQKQALEVWGVDQIDGWKLMASYTTDKVFYNSPEKPQILLPDLELDDGSAALQYSDGSHQLVFTEPLIIAALAAAPCATDLGQDLGESCRTAFGTAISSTSQVTDGWNITTGAHVGYEGEVSILGVTAGVEVMADITETVRKWTTDTYTTKKTVVRETGAIEDSVILSVLPMDVYNYTILSHPDASLVGGVVQVRMPRELITTMVTLDYYNDRIASPGKRIPDSVFRHTAGMPSSYINATQKDGILASNTGLESDEFTTGVGLGQTIASITDFTATSTGSAYELQANLTVLATAGVDNAFANGQVMGGFSIGGGINSALEITRGSENIYQGSVGNISASAFDAGQSYNWGLFSYIFDDAGYHQPFEVVNYWVE